jgi:ubiquinone/menaquinone biosynthesis C-methylase UbiE
MASKVDITAQHWNEHGARFGARKTGLFWWEAGPELRRYINTRISGNPNIGWIEHTLDEYFNGKLPLDTCLSLGCGTGHLERALAKLGAFQHCDAFDVAEHSIQEAQRLATEEGIASISYRVTDVNKIVLPANSYDAVWIHSAMHHCEALEHICRQIKQALKPGGLLILNEYVGPNRFQFSARQKEIANLCFHLLPARYRVPLEEAVALELERNPFKKGARWFVSRLIEKIREGDVINVIKRRFRVYRAKLSGRNLERTAVSFPSAPGVIAVDPSEAIRSEEILRVLQEDFQIVEERGWGGNVLQFLLADITGNFSEDAQSQALLRMLINIEDTMLQCGEFESDFAYIVARPNKA